VVFTEVADGQTTYRVEDGPFTEDELAALPATTWTLLVQDVEKHLPEFRLYLSAVDFIPDWRIDDLMVSCAAPGGSVGPHRDHYDVFLCQGTGRRKWMLGDAAEATPDSDASQLSLLKPFAPTATHIAETGDVLYLPPGVPHWGVAEELCVTYSIGMRAPNAAELACGAERIYKEAGGISITDASEAVFYTDADLLAEEAEPGRISARAVERLKDQCLPGHSLSDEQIATILGSVNTDTKAWLTPETLSRNQAAEFLDQAAGQSGLPVHGMARIAYFNSGSTRLFFANGYVLQLGEHEITIAHELCAGRRVCLEGLGDGSETRDLLRWLIAKGVIDTEQ
jgi:50S ribosomal protein L16 3-hydroxylase